MLPVWRWFFRRCSLELEEEGVSSMAIAEEEEELLCRLMIGRSICCCAAAATTVIDAASGRGLFKRCLCDKRGLEGIRQVMENS